MEQALYQAAIMTFEELGFVFPFNAKDTPADDWSSISTVSVSFHGEFDGEIFLNIEDTALSAIAENMLGEDLAADPALVQDVLGELANVICGNALPAIAGNTHIFKLNAPTFRSGPEKIKTASAITRLGMDEGRADVSLFID